MNEEKAWLNFMNTGKVEDYLLYNEYKHESIKIAQEGMNNENQSQWIGREGIKFGGT